MQENDALHRNINGEKGIKKEKRGKVKIATLLHSSTNDVVKDTFYDVLCLSSLTLVAVIFAQYGICHIWIHRV